MRRTLALLAAAVVALVACGGDDDASTPVAPVEWTRLSEGPGFFQSISPDGRWVAASGDDDQVCLTPTDEPGEPVCADSPGRAGVLLDWAPDSSAVVMVPDVPRFLEIGPVVVVGVDGSRVEVAQPLPDDEPFGAPVDAVFDGPDHVVYLVPLEDPFRLEVRRVGADGSDDELLAELEEREDGPLIPDHGMLFDDDGLHLAFSAGPEDDRGAWSYDLDNGEREALIVGEEARDEIGAPTGVRAMAVGSEVELFVEMFPVFGGLEERGDNLLLRSPDGAITRILDRGRFRAAGATLSPDGAQLAIVSVSDDEERAMRVSTATVESVISGSPEWHDLDGLTGLVAPDLRNGISNVVWTDDDRLVIGTFEDGILAVELAPVE